MSIITINGGRRLSGSVAVQGAKNSVLPILSATVLSGKESVIHGCPDLKDVQSAIKILEYLGCKVKREGDNVTVDSSAVSKSSIPPELMQETRSSITFLGALLSRLKKASLTSPGGCEIGPRPIDIHIRALKEMGAVVDDRAGVTKVSANTLRACEIHLDFPSVGATENIMLAATGAKGETVITNAAKEPEVVDLQDFLNKIGAKVYGAGTDTIRIEPAKEFYNAEHRIIGDRIVAATYLFGAGACGGEIEILGVEPDHIMSILSVLKGAGAELKISENAIILKAEKRLKSIDIIRTMPYPGFPTDAQAPITALLSVSAGTSIVVENIFENRFMHCGELSKMGADITAKGDVAVIKGVKELYGASVTANELRGGAALVIAGAAADGETEVRGVKYIERGYENIVRDMQLLGASIKKGREF